MGRLRAARRAAATLPTVKPIYLTPIIARRPCAVKHFGKFMFFCLPLFAFLRAFCLRRAFKQSLRRVAAQIFVDISARIDHTNYKRIAKVSSIEFPICILATMREHCRGAAAGITV
jgi:hypothetical protein